MSDKQVDFPIGFAEVRDNDQVYYTEWLDNSHEFPRLTPTKQNETHWELLDKVEKEELTVVQEPDQWAKINAFDMHSYLDVAERHADALKPTKRTVQPLYPLQEDKPISKQYTCKEEQEEEDMIYDTHKSQRKLAQRSTHLSLVQRLKTLDTVLPGILEMGTSKSKEAKDHVVPPNFKSKKQALATEACFQKSPYSPPRTDALHQKGQKVDDKEYNVLNNNRKQRSKYHF